MSPSRSEEILKGNSAEQNDSPDNSADTQALSLTSVSDRTLTPKAAETPKVAETPKPASPTNSINATIVLPTGDSETLLARSTSLAAADSRSKFAGLVSHNNEAQQKLQERKDASVIGRFTMGLGDNLVGQAEGLGEIAFGKRDQTTELTSTLTGKKTGNEHVLVNVTKTTLTVGGVALDLGKDAVGAGDGKTSAAFSAAISKSYNSFVNGSAGDRAEFLGHATGFLGTLAIGGGSTYKGTTGLATDIRAMRTLIQAEKQTASLATATRVIRPTEKVVAAAERLAVAAGDDVLKVAAAGTDDVVRTAARTATTTGVSKPGSLQTAWNWMADKGRVIKTELANTFVPPGGSPGLQPAFAGFPAGGSRTTALVGENTVARTGSAFVRSGDDATALLARTQGAGRGSVPKVGGVVDETAGVGTTKLGGRGTTGRAATEVVEGTPKKPVTPPRGETPVLKVEPPAGRPAVAPEIKPGGLVDDTKAAVTVADEGGTALVGKPGKANPATVVDDGRAIAPVGKPGKANPAAVVDDGRSIAPVADDAGKIKVVDEVAGGTPGARATGAADNTVAAVDDTRLVKPAGEVRPNAGEVRPNAGPTEVVKPNAGQVRPVEVPAADVRLAAIENGTKTLATTGDNISVEATRLAQTTGRAVKGDLEEIARLGKQLGKGDDVATVAGINERLANVSKTAGADLADEIARTLKPSVQKVEAAVAENGALRSAHSIEQRIARMSDNLTGAEAATIRQNLQTVQNGTRQLVSTGDDAAQVQTRIEQALRNLEQSAGKSPISDDIARLARETRELQTSVNVSRRLTAIESNSRALVTTGDDMAREVGKLAPKIGRTEADEIAKLTRQLGKGGDDLQVVERINERISNIARTHGTDVADDVARTLKPSLQTAESTALKNGALRAANNVEQRIARLTENLTGPEAAAIRQNLQTVQTGTRQLASTADNTAQINETIDAAMRSLQARTVNSPIADDVARLASETRQLQTTANVSRRVAAIENNGRVLVSTGDDIAREMTQLSPKVGAAARADADEIVRLSRNLGKGGDDLQTVRAINERVANISKTAGSEVGDDIARTLRPALQKAETTAVQNGTLRAANQIEKTTVKLLDDLTPTSALRADVATVRQNVQRLVAGGDDAVATARIDRAISELQQTAGGTRHADDITRLTRQTRELQTSVTASRRLAAIEGNTGAIATTGGRLSDDALRLAADPAKAVAKTDLDEIARLSRNLGKGGDDLVAVNRINERLASISRNAGADVADDIGRALRPNLQKVEAAAVQNSAIRAAQNLEQRIARIADNVVGPEAAAIRSNLTALQQGTRSFVASADNAAASSDDISRALQNLERAGARTNVSDDIARLARETRDMQVSVNASRRVSAIENSARTLVNDGAAISDEVTRLAATRGGAAARADLDEISRLSRNLGKTGDDLDTVRKINERVANITRTAGADADDVVRALTPKVQKAEAAAIESSRLKGVHQVAARVETESKAIADATRNIARTIDTTTTEGRVLQQQIQAIQRTADNVPGSVNPAGDARRLRTMVDAVERSVPATERAALRTAANNLDNAARDLSGMRTLGTQSARVEQTATTLRGTVTQVQDEITAGTRTVKRGTDDTVNRALTTIDENAAAIQNKLGTTARVDRELREINGAIASLEQNGQTRLARTLSQQTRELETASTARMYEVSSAQGPILSHVADQQKLIARTFDGVERDLTALRSWGNIRGTGKLDTITDLQEKLNLLRHVGSNDARLMAYADDAQTALSRIEMSALARGGAAVDRASAPSLLALAEAGNPNAIQRLFVDGLRSDGWKMRALANSPETVMGRLGLSGLDRIWMRPEFWRISGSAGLHTAMTGFGLATLYGNYNYHSQALLRAIEAEMRPDYSPGALETKNAQQSSDRRSDTTNDSTHEAGYAPQRSADLDFSPAVAEISRHIDFSPAAHSLAVRYGFSMEDPNAQEKADSIIYTGKVRRWSQAGGQSIAVEEPVRQNVPTARSIRIKGPDGVSFDPTTHPKTAVTSFSFTRAMALTNQLKLMTGSSDNRGASKAGTGFGGPGSGGSTPSLSQNLRTMVAFGSIRTDSGSSHASEQHREGTEDAGLDRAGSASPNSAPQVVALNSTGNGEPAADPSAAGATTIVPGGATVPPNTATALREEALEA